MCSSDLDPLSSQVCCHINKLAELTAKPSKEIRKQKLSSKKETFHYIASLLCKLAELTAKRSISSALKTEQESIKYKNRSSSPRSISIGQLNALLHLHLRPINLVVCKGSYSFDGISYLEVSFTLRCFQRLSHPHFATLPCRWRDNRCTIGAFIPVLSY